LIDFNCNIESRNLFNDFYLGKVKINSLGPLWRADILLKYRFDEELLYSEEEILFKNLFKRKNGYIPINYVLFYYRKHEISNTKLRYDLSILIGSKIKSEIQLVFFC
jgi:GalNAc5-diNAcBac-PP-undecaprenol beta-1,3-glucosyltransferase